MLDHHSLKPERDRLIWSGIFRLRSEQFAWSSSPLVEIEKICQTRATYRDTRSVLGLDFAHNTDTNPNSQDDRGVG